MWRSIAFGLLAILMVPFFMEGPWSSALTDPADLRRWIVAHAACVEANFILDNDAACQRWYVEDDGPPTDILSCPPFLGQAKVDERFELDESTGWTLQVFHKGVEHSFRQKIPNSKGAGQQCTYKDGKLLLGPPGGGTSDVASPVKSKFNHWRQDVAPWCKCCHFAKDPGSCAKYYEKRPSELDINYVFL